MASAIDAIKYLVSGKSVFDNICNLIIRPPRADYDPEIDLGPEIFRIGDTDSTRYRRNDFSLENMRGMTIQCSWFRPIGLVRQPCVVYVHANCGSRYDALEALYLIRQGVSLFAFDATGSGLSDGEYISLGFYERQDLAAVVDYLTSQKEVDCIGLWGRSMGAITSIMYASKDTSIKCIVCDSPFSTLRLLIRDLVKRNGSKHIPSGIVDVIVDRIRKRIAKLAAFDIDDLNALKYAADCAVPAFIFHGKEDDFVLPKHSVAVRDAFAGSCLHHMVEGGHNDERDEKTQATITAFFHLYLIDKPQAERERRRPEAQTSAVLEAIPGVGLLLGSPSDGTGGEEGDGPHTAHKTAPLVPISFTKPRLRDAASSTEEKTDTS